MEKDNAYQAYDLLSKLVQYSQNNDSNMNTSLLRIGIFANRGFSSADRAYNNPDLFSPNSCGICTLSELTQYEQVIHQQISFAKENGFSSTSILIGQDLESSKKANLIAAEAHLLNHWVALAFQKRDGKIEATLFNSLGNQYAWVESEIKKYLPAGVTLRAIHSKLQHENVHCLEYSTMYRVLLEHHNSQETFPNPDSLNDQLLQKIAPDAAKVINIARSKTPLEALICLNQQNPKWASDLRAFECLNALQTKNISLHDIRLLANQIDEINLRTDDPATLTLLASIVLIVSGLSVHISLMTAFGVGGTALSGREIMLRLSKPPRSEEVDQLERAITAMQP